MSEKEYENYNKSLKSGAQNTLSMISKYYGENVVMDVGSNTGMFIECVLEAFKDARVLAFEPVKRYFDYSVKKFKNNKNVIIENFALSDEEKEDYIFIATNNIGWNTLVKEKIDNDNANTKELIQCICFDDYFEKHEIGKIDILKIDTEGFEYKVLKGMKKFLKIQKPVIVCEVGWGCEHPYWNKELEMFNYLYSIGYDKSTENKIKNLKQTEDIVFLPL